MGNQSKRLHWKNGKRINKGKKNVHAHEFKGGACIKCGKSGKVKPQ